MCTLNSYGPTEIPIISSYTCLWSTLWFPVTLYSFYVLSLQQFKLSAWANSTSRKPWLPSRLKGSGWVSRWGPCTWWWHPCQSCPAPVSTSESTSDLRVVLLFFCPPQPCALWCPCSYHFPDNVSFNPLITLLLFCCILNCPLVKEMTFAVDNFRIWSVPPKHRKKKCSCHLPFS